MQTSILIFRYQSQSYNTHGYDVQSKFWFVAIDFIVSPESSCSPVSGCISANLLQCFKSTPLFCYQNWVEMQFIRNSVVIVGCSRNWSENDKQDIIANAGSMMNIMNLYYFSQFVLVPWCIFSLLRAGIGRGFELHFPWRYIITTMRESKNSYCDIKVTLGPVGTVRASLWQLSPGSRYSSKIILQNKKFAYECICPKIFIKSWDHVRRA